MARVNSVENVVLTLACFAALFVCSGDAYICYECQSLSNPDCADPMKKNFLSMIECKDFNQELGCAKTISKTDDGIKITRGCLLRADEDQMFPDPSIICANRPYSSDLVCRCYSNMCNRATTSITSLSLWILLPALVLAQVV